jgi:metal-responsive CopG/Arc/MetJ family transcriptional regulator
MEIKGYKERNEKKKDIVYVRLDESMIKKLDEIRVKLGVSKSESIREAIRRLLRDVEKNGSLNITL